MKLNTSSIITVILLAAMFGLVALNPFGRNIVVHQDVGPTLSAK
ncbi:hypothetical protein GGE16_004321 [Rhizobium leguminosarum]|uniref:Uncharacterized protein n=1 Tax=Rhizobium leguminosarum TaxID=384 RepID=A0AAE2MN49_RHILE|nr:MULTISPECIES: hypothetical protein [Rhizobium]MBB4292245.1 hypothetical protein [Rhizobium leguminosarum]MBB4299794.1 hypothetical protein [Rhizobium leguminosarum]MBB4309817.1 hypothetical protein [Rhizobium leguminosarum]MBB4419443.1 hypothetical protein [Rhizobium leguminosarum]MBB4434246.1 hypothetical protein [Rhizobium esperanzae]